MTRPLVFVVPAMTASISGGNLYNLGLTSALDAAGVDVTVTGLDDAESVLRRTAGLALVDSLYLEALPRLKRGVSGRTLYLLAHYLPSLVAHRAVPAPTLLSAPERAVLAAADGFLAPSRFMADALAALMPQPRPVLVVAPGLAIDGVARAPRTDDLLRAVMVANLVPGKGVLPFLDALAPQLRAGARLRLTIVGSLDSDGDYAAACQARIAGEAALASSVRLAGALGHPATLAEVAASDVFISASRMESFGLGLAEARSLGVPILAHTGGNAAAHVAVTAGGRLLPSDEDLAAECARLAGDPKELAERRDAAHDGRSPSRTWADAARELVALMDRTSE